MTTTKAAQLSLSGLGPVELISQRGMARKAVKVRTGAPLFTFAGVDAWAVADRWRSDGGYPLYAHLFDFLTQSGYRFDPENAADREIYNGLYDWIAELTGTGR